VLVDQVWKAITHWIDAALGLLTPEQWDAWLGWVTGIGGLIALSVAVLTYRRNVRLKREESARLVYANVIREATYLAGSSFETKSKRGDLLFTTVTDIVARTEFPKGGRSRKRTVVVAKPLVRMTVVVRNGSKERIGPVYTHPFNRSTNRRIDFAPEVYYIDPDSDAVVDVLFPLPKEGQPEVGTTIVFRDSAGRWWKRHLAGPLKKGRRVKSERARGVYRQLDPNSPEFLIGSPSDGSAGGSFITNVVGRRTPLAWARAQFKKVRARFKKKP